MSDVFDYTLRAAIPGSKIRVFDIIRSRKHFSHKSIQKKICSRMIFDVQFREVPIDHDQFRAIPSLLMMFSTCIIINIIYRRKIKQRVT